MGRRMRSTAQKRAGGPPRPPEPMSLLFSIVITMTMMVSDDDNSDVMARISFVGIFMIIIMMRGAMGLT